MRPRPANLEQEVLGGSSHIGFRHPDLMDVGSSDGLLSVRPLAHYGSLGNFERFVIFLAGSFITRATITNHETRMQLSCWAASAIIVEVARQWVSGRSNGIMGWLASVIGAGIGAVSARHIAHNDFWRWGW